MKTFIQKCTPEKDSPFVLTLFGASLLFFIIMVLLFTFSKVLPNAEIAKAAESKWDAPTSGSKSVLQVTIANNGTVYLKGARIESISGKNLVVSTTWKVVKIQWTIVTNGSSYGKHQFGTSFFDSKGNNLAISDFNVGDIISVSGTLDVDSEVPTINADYIR